MAGYDELSATVDRDRLLQHIGEFNRWTKHAGTPEELESLRYVEAEMRSYGYETQLITHPAYISLPGPASVERAGRRMRAITHSFSRPSPSIGQMSDWSPVLLGRA